MFLPFLVVTVAAKFGLLELRESWMWLGSWPAITAFATATALEIGAYYVPWLDNVLDSIATPAAGIAGMLMTVAVMPAANPETNDEFIQCASPYYIFMRGVYYDDIPTANTHVA